MLLSDLITDVVKDEKENVPYLLLQILTHQSEAIYDVLKRRFNSNKKINNNKEKKNTHNKTNPAPLNN